MQLQQIERIPGTKAQTYQLYREAKDPKEKIDRIQQNIFLASGLCYLSFGPQIKLQQLYFNNLPQRNIEALLGVSYTGLGDMSSHC